VIRTVVIYHEKYTQLKNRLIRAITLKPTQIHMSSAATIDALLPRRCRHCAGFSLAEKKTYASVLVAGDVLLETVELLERRIIPCVTAVCPNCDRVSLISDGSVDSMLCSIFMWQRLREWIDTDYCVSEVSEVLDSDIKDEILRRVMNGVRHEDRVNGSATHGQM
jgi:hypothetical protein